MIRSWAEVSSLVSGRSASRAADRVEVDVDTARQQGRFVEEPL